VKVYLWKKRKAAFRYPLGEAPRTAILVPWFAEPRFAFRSREAVRSFAGWSEEVAKFAPAAIVGTRAQLLSLAENAPTITHALIAVGSPTDMLLSVADRDRLWRAFRVPVFEQLIGSRGQRLAAECEAHDGLHIEVPNRDWTGYARDEGLCACGLRTPRVSSPVPAERIRSAAMYAR
jgi:hypothetical protein